jgi:CRP/FNR family transcriptional regulator
MEAGEPMRLLRGEVLFREGERGDSCYWVEKGTLKIGVSSETGEERIFSLAGPGSVVGELSILDKLPRSATVTAISDTNLTALKRDSLEAYLRQNPDVSADLIAILVGRLRKTNQELAADSFLSVQARVARAILNLANQVGEPDGSDLFILPATVSQSDIGAMAGVARESVSRTLSEWRRRGIITAPGRKLSVKRSKLEKEAKD